MMPPMPFPPMMMPPSPRGGAGRGIVIAILLVLLIGSVLLNFLLGAGLMVGGALSIDGHDITQTTIKIGAADQQIAVIPLDGIITDQTREKFNRYLERIADDKSIKALVIDIDSPGGEVTASDEIYAVLMKFKAEHPGLPVAASMRSLCASGAYYAACAADHLVAEETTMTGSIGVLWPSYNVSELLQKYGVKDTTIISSGTPYKDVGSWSQPLKPESREYLQGLVDSALTRFKSIVSKSRGPRLSPGIDQIADGRIYTSQEAKRNGLIDEIGYFENAVAWAAKTASLSNPSILKYQERPSILDHFPFAMRRGRPASSIGVNGVDIQVDPAVLDRLAHPRPMYIVH